MSIVTVGKRYNWLLEYETTRKNDSLCGEHGNGLVSNKSWKWWWAICEENEKQFLCKPIFGESCKEWKSCRRVEFIVSCNWLVFLLITGFILSCTMKKYHPSRVLTLVYQPFALATMAILVYNEARINTRKRNLAGFTLFFLSTFALLVVCSDKLCCHFSFFLFIPTWLFLHILLVGFGHIRSGRSWKLHWYMCYCCCFWSCWCFCWRWDGRRFILHVPWIHPSKILSSNKLLLYFLKPQLFLSSDFCYYLLSLQCFP